MTWKKPIFQKNRCFGEIAWKNLNFSENVLQNRMFFTLVHEPKISNQIDAAGPQWKSAEAGEGVW